MQDVHDQEPQRLNLDLPDLPLSHEEGEITVTGTHFFNKDIYLGESLHPDHITPLIQDPEQHQPTKQPTFKSARPK